MSLSLSSGTLGGYVTEVRDLLNQPNAANSFWTDQEITRYLNEAIRMYYLEVTNANEGFWTTTADLNIVANQDAVTLPTNCFEVKAVYKTLSQGYQVLPYRNAISDSYSTQGGTGPETYTPSYYFRENTLVLRPVPNFSQTAGLKLEYMYFPDQFQDAGDVMSANMLPIFRQLIVMYAVVKAKTKESMVNGTDTTALAKSNLADIYKLFKDTVEARSKFPQFTKAFSPEDTY